MLYFGDLLAFNASRIYVCIYISILSVSFCFYIFIVKFQKALEELNCSDARSVQKCPWESLEHQILMHSGDWAEPEVSNSTEGRMWTLLFTFTITDTTTESQHLLFLTGRQRCGSLSHTSWWCSNGLNNLLGFSWKSINGVHVSRQHGSDQLW